MESPRLREVLRLCWNLSFLIYKVGGRGVVRAEALKNSRELDLMFPGTIKLARHPLPASSRRQARPTLCPKRDGEEKVTGNVGEGLVRPRMA